MTHVPPRPPSSCPQDGPSALARPGLPGSNLARARSRALALGLLLAFVTLPACTLFQGDDKTKPTSTRPPAGGSCQARKNHELVPASSSGSNCEFEPVEIRNSRCQVLKASVEASGGSQSPASVIFEWNGIVSDRPLTFPEGVSWAATSNAINCSSAPGCADGTYTVQLANQENPVPCAEFGTVTLKLVLQ